MLPIRKGTIKYGDFCSMKGRANTSIKNKLLGSSTLYALQLNSSMHIIAIAKDGTLADIVRGN